MARNVVALREAAPAPFLQPGTDLVPDGWCEDVVMPWADEQAQEASIAQASAHVAGLEAAYATLGADTLELTRARRYLEVWSWEVPSPCGLGDEPFTRSHPLFLWVPEPYSQRAAMGAKRGMTAHGDDDPMARELERAAAINRILRRALARIAAAESGVWGTIAGGALRDVHDLETGQEDR